MGAAAGRWRHGSARGRAFLLQAAAAAWGVKAARRWRSNDAWQDEFFATAPRSARRCVGEACAHHDAARSVQLLRDRHINHRGRHDCDGRGEREKSLEVELPRAVCVGSRHRSATVAQDATRRARPLADAFSPRRGRVGAGLRMPSGCTCAIFRYFPLQNSFALALLIGGTVLWASAVADAADRTLDVFDLLGASNELRNICAAYVSNVTAVSIAVLVTAFITAVMSAWRIRLRLRKRGKKTATAPQCVGCAHGAAAWTLIVAVYVLTAYLVVLLAVDTTWFAGSIVTREGATAVADLHAQLRGATSTALAAADQVLGAVNAVISVIDELPPLLAREVRELAASVGVPTTTEELSSEVGRALDEIEPLRRLTTGSPAPIGGCPPTCLNLSYYSFVSSDSCVCEPEAVLEVRDHAEAARESLLSALIGNALMYLGGSWLLASLTADLVNVRRDYRALRRVSGSGDKVAQEGAVRAHVPRGGDERGAVRGIWTPQTDDVARVRAAPRAASGVASGAGASTSVPLSQSSWQPWPAKAPRL
ncbi:unnamed protein product [Pedinophyceae sp. YPF-701]|nr:unnamed protein product [Pedinophyceae sp. YPF-701]